jgi:hypothetical protein
MLWYEMTIAQNIWFIALAGAITTDVARNLYYNAFSGYNQIGTTNRNNGIFNLRTNVYKIYNSSVEKKYSHGWNRSS